MFSRFFLSLTFLFSFFIPFSQAGTPDTTGITVSTKQGILNGTTEDDVRVWRGVRYAQAPVNELRYKLPQPLQSWEGTRDATQFGNIAPQPKNDMGGDGVQNEDCLFLNIWSPKISENKKPVMFWIHGGGFVMGSGSSDMYNGTKLSKNGDVVVVTINYRLGPLGFLYLDELKNDSLQFESNLGLHDQVAALKWVKENISAFGGDPENITIFGESAGANSVLSLLASPYAKGLFSKSIVQSAAGVSVITKEKATQQTKEFLEILGIAPTELSKLYSISPDTLMAASDRYLEKKIREQDDVLFFVPVSGTDFLPLPPKEAIAQGVAKGIPMLIGTNRDEANLFAKMKPAIIEPEVKTVHNYLKSNGLSTHEQHLISLYPKFPSRTSILSMITDAIFQLPSVYIADAQSNFASAYSYRFDWTSFPIRLIGLGACHGMELPFVFNTFNSGAGKRIMKASNKRKVFKLSKEIQTAWTNFAHTGNPDSGNNKWLPYNTESRSTLIFDNTIKVVSDPIAKLREGWKIIQ